MADVTQLLDSAKRGDRHAANELLAAVYAELRHLAACKLARERPGQTLQATALVHDAYLRLLGQESADWENRQHFFAAAAEAMRRILVETARRKARVKHGGDLRRVELDAISPAVLPEAIDLVALDEALTRLSEIDPVKAKLVTLRYFGGLTVVQASETLGVSRATANRYWTFARAWLYHEVSKGDHRQ